MKQTPSNGPRRELALVIPALDPGRELPGLLARLRPDWAGPVVVVDDGSGRQAQAVFAAAGQLGATVLHHGGNRGSLVLGVRDFSAPGVPLRSRLGNRLTRWALRLACGLRLADTQTGLRGIPMDLVPELTGLPGSRYEFETAMLLAAQSAGRTFVQVPIATVYADGNRGSHFRPLADGLRVWAQLAGPLRRFAGASLASAAVDLGLFAVLARWLRPLGGWHLAAATLGARAVSACCNFALNRALVFRLRQGAGRAAGRYALLCLCQAAASALLTTLLAAALPLPETLCKILIDTALFFLGYAVQRRWVFAPADPKGGHAP